MSFTSIKFRLWAEVEGITVDVVQFTCSYEMNRIPKATCVLPVGRNARTLAVSTAHDITEDIEIQQSVKVFVEVLHGGGLGNNRAIVTPGEYLLFEGFVTGLGYRRKGNSLNLALEMTHWLSGLNFASALSGSSHPGNPYMLTFNASFSGPMDGAEAGEGLNGKHWIRTTMAQEAIDTAAVRKDLWGEAILPWFKELTGTDRLLAQEGLFGADAADAANNDSANGEALAALNRFAGDILPLDTVVDDETDLVAAAIADDLAVSSTNAAEGANHFAALSNTTIWSKLVGHFAQMYMFSVIPYPDRAKVVPFVPGLREVHNPRGEKYSVLGRDLDYLDLSSKLPRALRAVGLFGGHDNDSGADLGAHNVPKDINDVTGIYVGRDDGMVMFKLAPRWLTHIGSPWTASLATAGIGSVRSDAFNPKAAPNAGEIDLRDARKNFKNLMDSMAHTLYAYEVLKGRVGHISGAVRFDISPGSTISIEGTGGAFIGGNDPLGEARYATVLRTTHIFDAEARSAGTAFQLGHIRNAKENENEDTSLDRHPLYNRQWAGDISVRTTAEIAAEA